MICRVCGLPSVAFDEDGSINHDHDRCDEIIRLANQPSIVPPGVSIADHDRARLEWAKEHV